ncbi:cytochrome C biogenesis protein [Kaistia algarum]|uniref:cytochrome c biogenesis CcdA family protein n=1 Tax=Kaistia algarum TaxID=2083279 RepID=UPI000CE7C86F|nr:cytochrome c biogenesis protein CcdA [Kaistia algarum]MCX5512664.1 sulfite exporter TauE/SafE family protein [Kaistia algarum]PPE81825.1 cytochrome C biogenesis protein [Kaistia algarum]
MAAIALAFLAGLLTITNPCVLPLAPIVIAGARARDPLGPVALALGLAVTFGIIGGILAALGTELGDTGPGRIVIAILLIGFGIVSIVPALAHRAEMMMAPLGALADGVAGRLPISGLAAQALLGALLALAWAPCVGPTLGAALALAAGGGSLAAAMITMMVFALGAAASLLIAGFLFGLLARRGKLVAGRSAAIGRTLLGLAFILVGLGMLTGYDRVVEGALVEAMPDWLVTFGTQL